MGSGLNSPLDFGRTVLLLGMPPIPGIDANFTIPARTRILICTISWDFSRTAINGQQALWIQRSGNLFVTTRHYGNLGSKYYHMCAMAGGPMFFSNYAEASYLPLPNYLTLEAGDIISTHTVAFNPGDQVGNLKVFGYRMPLLEP